MSRVDLKIAAGIVTFEPDIVRLRENIEGISAQVGTILVLDNGSTNVDQVARLCERYSSVELLPHPQNSGIAYALNRLAEAAAFAGYSHLVTLDQDSVSPVGMVGELAKRVDHSDIALVTPYIVDINKMSNAEYALLSLPETTEYTQAARRGAITSGALLDLDAWRTVGGFDDHLFIDYVDYDLNQRLLLSGYRIIRANRTHLMHEVGRAAATWLRIPRKDVDGAWRLERFYSFGHSPQRCYYKTRNRIIFTRKYFRSIGVTHEGVFQLPQQMALTLLFEKERGPKLASFLRGIRDGWRHRVSPYRAAGAGR